jgi:hypothetical protein
MPDVLRFRNEFEVKLRLKTGNIFTISKQYAQFHTINFLFCQQKYSPKKLIPRHNEQPNTITSRLSEKISAGSETN